MSVTEIYKKQHKELLDIVGQLSPKLNLNTIQSNPKDVQDLLFQFSSKLKVHLNMEDHSMYPKLLASSNSMIVNTAKDYQTEMGGIKQILDNYLKHWTVRENLIKEPDKFITQTKELTLALKARIQKEDTILYPMFERLEKINS